MIRNLFRSKLGLTLLLLLYMPLSLHLTGQISPGELSEAHTHLEGISNCTQCHDIGKRISPTKCLSCHIEINARLKAGKGYHSSAEVKAKQCIECHNEHHGKKFRLIQLETESFNHTLTGYRLSVPHSTIDCGKCHQPSLIKDPEIRKKKYTYLGLGNACLDCHADYHLGTLSPACLDCHAEGSFKTAPKFNHDNAKFRLAGKHKTVKCAECHKTETVNGQPFVEFRGVSFTSCRDCHNDPHNNKFGPDCRKCHNENSFTGVKDIEGFDHSTTGFVLEGKHLSVDCRSCHKNGLTSKLKHERCLDCHTDYHKGEFLTKTGLIDCSECHDTKGFQFTSYSLEKHNRSAFPLQGAHMPVPCTECHKKANEWTFRKTGMECRDCHSDIHKEYIDQKHYPGGNCLKCHNETAWNNIQFDHSATSFNLTGKHESTGCAECHIKRLPGQPLNQKFKGLPSECSSCHDDPHGNQFEGGSCIKCHNTNNWEPRGFDHSKTAFKLDGKHENVPCAGCHKPVDGVSVKFTVYKIKDFRCESCHF